MVVRAGHCAERLLSCQEDWSRRRKQKQLDVKKTFSNIFTKDVAGNHTRVSMAYYPHQVHTQLFDENMKFRKNKGIVMMRELLDFGIFHGGVVVNMKSGKIL